MSKNKEAITKYKSFDDFRVCFAPIKDFNFPISEDIKKDLMMSFECFLKKIEEAYQEGDEIWHYDDFKISPSRCGREYILIRRNNETIKRFLVRMS